MLSSGPPLILIAADDQAVREALEFALRIEGLSVRTHQESSALLADGDLAATRCIILDDRSPHRDGLELMRQLRSRHLEMPVILLASHATSQLRRRAADAGIRCVLEKPLLDNVLVDSLRAILGDAWPGGF